MCTKGTTYLTHTVHVFTHFSTCVHLQYCVIFVQSGLLSVHGVVVKQPYTTFI